MRPDDPDLLAGFAEFNSGVARSRAEYHAYPLVAYGRMRVGPNRCPECGERHKSKKRALCWRCVGPKS